MASNRAGLDVPWFYQRSVLARRWSVTPLVVDEMPVDECLQELKVMELESIAERERGRHG